MNKEVLKACLGCTDANAEKWAPHLTACMDCFEINTPLRQAAFLAQIGHESGLLTIGRENMNYSENGKDGKSGLLGVFPKYFDAAKAKAYAHHPEKIASCVYANRMGNGDEASLDGWKYRGGGLIQLTGFDNYRECGKGIGVDLLKNPELISEPRTSAMAAGWFWDRAGLNKWADIPNFEKVTRIINGGLNGQEARLELYAKAKAALGV